MSVNDFVISYQVHPVFFSILLPPMLFINYKLFVVMRKSRKKQKNIAWDEKNVFFEKYIELLVAW
jgi:hypothetical protein